MPAAAQATRAYDDYLDTLACTEADELSLLALGLIGPRNRVTKLVDGPQDIVPARTAGHRSAQAGQ